MSTGVGRSTRRNTTPVSTGAGRRVMRTFSPVCRPTPEALIRDLRERWRSIGGRILYVIRYLRLSAAPLAEQGQVAFFGLAGALLGVQLLGHVVDHAEARRAAVKVEVEGHHLHLDQLAVFLAVAPDA